MEVFKKIKGFKNYEISNLANVRRTEYLKEYSNGVLVNYKSKIMSLISDKDGYLKVNLTNNKKRTNLIVHRLVAIAFIPNPENKPQVNHINGIKDDNRIDNLEWCTLSENRQHAYDIGLQNSDSRKGEKNNFTKINKKIVFEIREMHESGFTQEIISVKFNISRSNISHIINKKSWKHV